MCFRKPTWNKWKRRSTAKTNSAFLSVDPIRKSLSRSDFSFAELRNDPITTVYVVIPGEYAQSLYAYNRLIMESAMRELMHKPSGRPVLFIIDEMPLLQRMEILETITAMGAGLNIRTWCLAQDIHQLKRLYPESYQSFLANAGAQQWFAPREEETAEYLSKRCGQRTVMVKNTSTREITVKEAQGGFTGLSHSYSPQPRALYLPQEIMAMRGDRQLLFLDGVENVVVAGRRPYWDIPEFKGRYDPNPYHVKP
jgi:type IV secretion system protein VirD4